MIRIQVKNVTSRLSSSFEYSNTSPKTLLKQRFPLKDKVITDDNSLSKNVTSKIDTEIYKFFVKGDKKHYYISTNDILFIEAYGSYAKLFLKNEIIISHENISYYEVFLESKGFIKTHKSFIVSLDKIKTY